MNTIDRIESLFEKGCTGLTIGRPPNPARLSSCKPVKPSLVAKRGIIFSARIKRPAIPSPIA